MVKLEEQEPLDKQQTEVIPAVQKPPTMNTLILDRMGDMEKSFSSSLGFSQHLTIIHKDQAKIIMQNWTNMILIGGAVAVGIVIIVMLSLVFGRMLP